MDSKKSLAVGALGLILAILIILVALDIAKKPAPVATAPANTAAPSPAPAVSVPSGQDQFRAAVPADIVVPDTSTVLTEAQKQVIAIPTVEVAAAPGVTPQLRSFNISAVGGKFVPSQVTVHVGDTVNINFTAVDGDYDVTFPSGGMKQVIAKGQTKPLQFQAGEDGSFLYYCAACGGPGSAATGQIIVVK